MKQGMAMFTSPEDHRCLPAWSPLYPAVLPPPLEVLLRLRQTPQSSFSKVDPPSAPEQEAAAAASVGLSAGCSSAARQEGRD